MKKILLISVIMVFLFVACKEEKSGVRSVKKIDGLNEIKNKNSQVDKENFYQIKTSEGKTNKTKIDSINKQNFHEHKSIHQIEWEKHQKDTVKNKIKPESVKLETVQLGKWENI